MFLVLYPWKPTYNDYLINITLHVMNNFLTKMATLADYRSTLRYLSKQEVVQQRLQLFHSINGNAFFPLTWWPDDMRMAFWKKPISDTDTFKLVLFFLGNGCSPHLFSEWIMLSQYWANYATAEKRARQIDYIVINADTKANCWFYYDVDHKKLLYLNGLPRSEPNKARQQ